MTYGGGTIWNVNNQVGPNGAPFPAGLANNGLSVDPVSGLFVLGQAVGEAGDPARLLSNREIPMGVFTLEFADNGGNGILFLDASGRIARIGDTDQAFNSTEVTIDDNTQIIEVAGLNINLGAVLVPGNGVRYFLDDPNQLHRFEVGTSGALVLDPTGVGYQMGDVDSAGNDTLIVVNDLLRRIELRAETETFIGDVLGTGNSFLIEINDLVQFARILSFGGAMLMLNRATGQYALGDVDSIVGGQHIMVDDVTNRFNVNTASGIWLNNDNVLMHSSVGFADGAAAAAGTLLNAPAAGDPTKWIPVDDNGTTRFIPAW